MRILDLGAHDGFVGTWLAKQMDGLHIDGVEANSQAVRIANERAEKHGIAGRYFQGLAEEASRFFDTHTYDAVVAFELIEHVTDVDQFLFAVEMMCKEGGRVYLSTPDGCFGEGNNPHHLRVYRAVDLFELCRRRGTIKNMIAGEDGVTVIAYEPSFSAFTKPEVGIYLGGGWEKWHPSDITTKGLGGSETAAIRLAESMSKFATVTVYGECDYCAWRQVSFKPHTTFDPMEEREALIVSRRPDIADRPMNAERKLLWMHDTDYGSAMTPERMNRFDDVLVLSEWHRDHLVYDFPLAVESERLRIFGNAIEPRYFGGSTDDRHPVAFYSSSPDRGLDLILQLWPRVREQVPEAELHFSYASVYHKVADQDFRVGQFRDRINKLADQPGVVNLGSLTQPQVAKQMQEARVWLAPSIHTMGDQKFYETYCIGAQEAAAGGAVIIASAWGALPERAEQATNSILVSNDDWKSEAWQDEWVASIVNGMSYPVNQPSNLALTTTWELRANQIRELIESGVPASR